MGCKWAVVFGERNFILICDKLKLSCSFSSELKWDDALFISNKIFQFSTLNLLLIDLSYSSKISLCIYTFVLA